MSILEDIASVAETPSPNTVQPRSRLRASTRISKRFSDQMREMDEKRNDTDESTPESRRRSSTSSRRRAVATPKRLKLSRSDSVESVESVGGAEEEDDENGEEEGEEEEEEEEERERNGRYSFRERGAMKKPARFDQNLYDDVFRPMRDYTEAQAARKARRRGSTEKKRSRGSSRNSKRRRLRGDDDDDDDDEQDEEDEDVVDELDYATDESDITQIQRRIEEQERAEAAEAAAAVAAVEALEQAPRHTRSTRYALRYQDGEDDDTTSRRGSLSPVRSSIESRRRTRRGLEKQTEEEEVDQEDEEDEEEGDGDDDDGDGDDNGEQEEEDVAENNDGRRYHLRRRSNSDLPDQEEEEDEDENEEARRRRTRAGSRRSISSSKSSKANRRDHRRRSGRGSVPNGRGVSAGASTFGSGGGEGEEPRYSLRDRSKVQRTGEPIAVKDPSLSVYADYAKRQASRTSAGRRPATGSMRRPARSGHKRRGEVRRRRSLSSSSSSGSSDDLYKYHDSDQGGMRGNSKKLGAAPVDRKRADISPVEVDKSITWDSVGGLEKHIEALKEMVMLPLLYPEFYEKYNVTPPSGVLFYGPPGTGKTLLARALANSCAVEDDSPATEISLDGSTVTPRKPRHVTFYMRKGADCLSKWVGEAERQLRLLFEEAKRNQPSIIFFDEIDGLAPVRSAKQDQIHASIVSTLLALMDGLDSRGRVVVIGATNRLDAIDPALRRPGRFDRELGFKLPNVDERKKMLEIHSKKWNPPLSEGFVQEVAQRTVGYCGADIKALCAEAALCSLKRVYPQVYASQDKLLIQLDKVIVTRGDFTKAMKKITPASHRTVSSFASPLPRGVKSLLDGPLHAILKKIAKEFPMFPLDPQAMDAIYKTDGGSASVGALCAGGRDDGGEDDDDDNEDDDIYAVMNRDDCDVCHGDEGELVCCDACPGAFHADCLPSDHGRPSKFSTEWFCPECNDSTKMEALLEAKRTKHKQRQARQMYMLPQLVGFPRVLITGVAGMGQQYIGAALLHAMEGLTHFSLDYPSLVADVNTHHAEEALIHRLNEAQKCLPCVLYLPQVDLWWENTTESMHIALKMMLMSMQIKSNLPVLFLATTSSTSLQQLPKTLLDLFTHDRTVQRSSITWELDQVSRDKRKTHFAQAFDAIGAEPLPRRKRRRGSEKLEVLPLAPVAKKTKREPTLEELARIREHDFHCLRELRIFLGQVLDYCSGQRNYSPFHHPVDIQAVPDYYLIIKHPMDLTTMREKLNDGDYTCFEQFLDDIQLIVRNANMFNPKRSATRHIAHAAGTMKDNILSFAHRFRKHQGYDLVAKCREITKRLHTNPTLYSELPDITDASGQRNAKLNRLAMAAPPSRTSARLQGIKAPSQEFIDGWTVAKPREQRVKVDSVVSTQATRDLAGEACSAEDPATQWFNSSKASVSPFKSGRRKETHAEAEAAMDDEMGDASDHSSDPNVLAEQEEIFEPGDAVFVRARTSPGMNKPGGAGKVVHRNDDGTYYIKYVLGGSEKNVEPVFISNLTDDAVKESVSKNQRQTTSASGADGALNNKADAPKSKSEMESEFFDNLVWPILIDEGWTRQEVTDLGDDGTTSLVVRFVSPFSTSTAQVAFDGVDQVLEYINADRELAVKCFGKRYAEQLPTEAVFGDASAENADVVATESVESVEETATEGGDTCSLDADDAAETAAETETTVEATTEVAGNGAENDDEEMEEEEEVAREFVYDEARMKTVLDQLVDKTSGWTVDELRDELLLLNKLAYPFRYEFDRSKLMEDVERHVANLRR